jgi:hypothetical protein
MLSTACSTHATLRWRMRVGLVGCLLAAIFGAASLAPNANTPLLASLAPADASAATVRYMAWNRYDVRLSGDETQSAGSSVGGAIFVCLTTPLVAAYYSTQGCTLMVGICAARAKARGRWAGMTVQPFTGGYWCWDY